MPCLVAVLWGATQAASAEPTLELSGCSQGFDAQALTRAVELEAKGDSAEYRLRAEFDCAAHGKVELSVRDQDKALLASTVVDLSALPAHTRTRLLAVVWAELMRALSLQGSTHDERAGESLPPAKAEPARQEPPPGLAQQTSTPLPPSQPLHTASRSNRGEPSPDFGYRPALLSWPRVHASLFALQAGFVLFDFLRAQDTFMGANFGGRIGPVSMLGFYVKHRSERTSLGNIDARVWGAGLELALWCGALRAFELCGVALSELGRGEVQGRAMYQVSASNSLHSFFASGALGLAAGVGKGRLAFEVAARGGLAHGPTARAVSQPVVALHGGFFGLTLSAAVNP